jgi:hypothetical protein
MPRNIPIKNIVDGVLSAYESAQKEYESMSGGWWLWQAPEYFITTHIAHKLQKLDGAKYITLEHGSTNALSVAGAKGRGRLSKHVREKGKVDILLWWGSDTPRAIIEVKNQIYSKEQYEKDINRIKAFLKRNNGASSLQFGIFSFYESAEDGKRKSAKDKVSARISGIFDKSKYILGSDFKVTLHKSALNEELEGNAWQAVCVLCRTRRAQKLRCIAH